MSNELKICDKMIGTSVEFTTFGRDFEKPIHAGVAQLVEHQLPKLRVASSSLVSRSGLKAAGFSPAAFFMLIRPFSCQNPP